MGCRLSLTDDDCDERTNNRQENERDNTKREREKKRGRKNDNGEEREGSAIDHRRGSFE